MSWSEQAFKARLVARAAELGKSFRALLAAAGIGHDTIDKEPAAGRRIDTLEKIAEAFSWSLADVMGHTVLGRISPELAQKAFTSAKRVIARLPRRAQTDDQRFVAAFVHLYDVFSRLEMDGANVDQNAKAVEETLIRAWEEGSADLPKVP